MVLKPALFVIGAITKIYSAKKDIVTARKIMIVAISSFTSLVCENLEIMTIFIFTEILTP